MNNNIFRVILALAVIIGFFLPWFQYSGSGWDIVRYSSGGDVTESIIRYSFLLIPFFALVVLIRSATGKTSSFLVRLLPFLVIALLSALFVLGVHDQGGNATAKDFFSILGVGYYVTALASLLLIFV